jgi:putative MATE family efflux protein
MQTLLSETELQTATARRGTWSLIKSGVRGHNAHPTEGPISESIILLAVPMVLEMCMESLFAVVDIFFVSRLGPAATAAVALTESMVAIVFTIAMGLSIGVAAVVARRMGEKNPDAAAVSTVQAIILGILISVVLGVLFSVSAPRLLQLMGADQDVLRAGTGYARLMLGSSGVILMLFMLNAAFRGAADAAVAMRVLWTANALNIVLCPVLIYGVGPFPELGVTGSAVATTTGRSCALLMQLFILWRGKANLKVKLHHIRLQVETMLRIIRLSGTATLQVFIGTASWIALIRVLAGFGTDALAGYTVAIRIVIFALLPAWGLANAAATIVGQSLGAKKPERAEQAVWIASKMNLVFLGSVGLVFLIFAPMIVSWFGGNEVTRDVAVHGLRIIAAGYLFYAYGMVVNNSFNGAGDTWTPTWLNFICFWLFEIPLAWFLSHRAGLGPNGAFIAVTTAFSLMAVLAVLLFRRGKWKQIAV